MDTMTPVSFEPLDYIYLPLEGGGSFTMLAGRDKPVIRTVPHQDELPLVPSTEPLLEKCLSEGEVPLWSRGDVVVVEYPGGRAKYYYGTPCVINFTVELHWIEARKEWVLFYRHDAIVELDYEVDTYRLFVGGPFTLNEKWKEKVHLLGISDLRKRRNKLDIILLIL